MAIGAVAPAVLAAPPPAGGSPGAEGASSPIAPAVASPSAIERHVIGIEDSDILVDLTAKDGAEDGAELTLLRPVRLVHPVTHKLVIDRYKIGTLRIVQVQSALSVARATGALLSKPSPGDVVVLLRAPTPPPAAAAPSPSAAPAVKQWPAPDDRGATLHEDVKPAASPPPVAGDEAAVSALFDHLAGASLVTRIRRYETYAAAHPESPSARVLLEEAAALRELVSFRERGEMDAPSLRHFDVPDQVLDRTPLMFTVELSGQVKGAVLEERLPHEAGYRSIPMSPAGKGYFTAILPADRVVAPRIEYFVEAVRPSGEVDPVAGSAGAPLGTTVTHVSGPELATPHETTFAMSSDYADYNRLRGNDYTFQTEGAFTMRFSDVGVRSFGGGFGVYRGVGGSVRDLDQLGREPRSVGLTYGYVEGEFGVKPAISLVARAVLGLRDIGTAGGAQLGFRVGNDLATNLLVSGEVLGGVGLRAALQLSIQPRGRVPVLIRSEVTNQPAGSGGDPNEDPSIGPDESITAGDVGLRGLVQVGYRFIPSLVVALRASYEGRTISHTGPGLGGAVEYRW